MNESARIEKNNAIKEHGKETRARHASMRPAVIEMKLDLKCLNKTEQEKLRHYFTQCRWLCNYLISLDADAFKSFNPKTRDIISLDKDGNAVERCLTMPAKFIQAYHDITKGRKLIVIQDENIKGWHKGLFGKQVQNSALGTLKAKLIANPNVLVVDRFFPSTKMCPQCGAINEGITLSDRVFACGCGYTEDRDVKAAKTMLLAGRHIMSCTLAERKCTPEERKLDFNTSYEIWKLSAKRPEKGKSPEAPSSSVS